jgi:5-methylcytosine-specific restriction endonuclease McrA
MSLIEDVINRACKKCGTFGDESLTPIHAHHIIPKRYGGVDTDGRDLLCERCHKAYHVFLEVNISPNPTKKEILYWYEKWLSI